MFKSHNILASMASSYDVNSRTNDSTVNITDILLQKIVIDKPLIWMNAAIFNEFFRLIDFLE